MSSLRRIIFFLSVTSQLNSQETKTRFKSMKCKVTNETIYKVRYCYVKVTRNTSTLMLNLTQHVFIGRPFYFDIESYYKYGMIYRNIFPTPKFELCETLKNLKNAHPFVTVLFGALGKSLGRIGEGCPFHAGDFDFQFQVNDFEWISVWPSGMYKMVVNVRVKSTLSLVVTIETEVKSKILTSFWMNKDQNSYLDAYCMDSLIVFDLDII